MLKNLSRIIRAGAVLSSGLLAASCVTSAAPDNAPADRGPENALAPEHAAAIGRQIWKNECGGTVEGLTSWNKGEDFPSLGIGHFIWYPPGIEGPFEESFPQLVSFLRSRGVDMPAWVASAKDAPWPTRSAFMADLDSPRMTQLRTFLKNTVPEQTDFIARRLHGALPKILAEAPASDRERVARNFHAVASTPAGLYALMDYVNFKGEGVKPTERYKGQGWGMLQVLQEMRGAPAGLAAAREFGDAADRVLTRRVQNAPRDESQWLRGWRNRCAQYGRLFAS